MSDFIVFATCLGAFVVGGGIVALAQYLYRVIVREYFDAC